MLNKKTLEPHRKKIGAELFKLREKKGVSMYAIEKGTGVRFEQIKNIEEGSANYTINSLLAYTAFLGYDLVFVDIKFLQEDNGKGAALAKRYPPPPPKDREIHQGGKSRRKR